MENYRCNLDFLSMWEAFVGFFVLVYLDMWAQ